jgi:hypothetical protein
MNAKMNVLVVGICLFGAILGWPNGAAATIYCTTNATIGMDYYLTMQSMIQPYDSGWYNGPTGRFIMTYSSMNPASMGLLPPAYCIETQTISIGGTYPYTVVDTASAPVPNGPSDTGGAPMGALKAAYLEELWGSFQSQVNSNVTGAAFALAVYEIVFEDLYVSSPPGWDVTVGKFKANNTGGSVSQAIAQANAWLGQVDGTGPTTSLRGLINSSHQDFITVPEPAALSVLVLGSLALIRRRRR